MGKEIFKEIPGYDGLYMASTLGRIYSIKSDIYLSPTIQNSGYYLIGLYKNRVCKKHLVHRLVALTFLDNPENLPEVNHGEFGKLDNSVSNLEWTTRKGNQQDAYDRGLINPPVMKGKDHPFYGKKTHLFGKKGANHPRFGKPGAEAKIILDTQTGIFYNSIREAADAKGLNRGTLSDKLIGKIKINNTSLIYA